MVGRKVPHSIPQPNRWRSLVQVKVPWPSFSLQVKITFLSLRSVDYANGSLFVVNGPEFRDELIEIRGFTFDLNNGDVTSKFGTFVDPHDIAVTSDAKEVKQRR